VNKRAGFVDERACSVVQQALFVNKRACFVNERARSVVQQALFVNKRAGFVDERACSVVQQALFVDERPIFVDKWIRLTWLTVLAVDKSGKRGENRIRSAGGGAKRILF
jgi:hypothetical protein